MASAPLMFALKLCNDLGKVHKLETYCCPFSRVWMIAKLLLRMTASASFRARLRGELPGERVTMTMAIAKIQSRGTDLPAIWSWAFPVPNLSSWAVSILHGKRPQIARDFLGIVRNSCNFRDADLSPCNFATTHFLAERSSLMTLQLRDHPFDSLHSGCLSPLNFVTHEMEDPFAPPRN